MTNKPNLAFLKVIWQWSMSCVDYILHQQAYLPLG